MQIALSKTANNKIAIDTLAEPRVSLPVPLYLRRPSNSRHYRHGIKTLNVSANSASIFSDVPLQFGSEIEVIAFNDRFSALAIVRHVERQRYGQWTIGIEFTEKWGRWVVI
jgi:hypothetical protein